MPRALEILANLALVVLVGSILLGWYLIEERNTPFDNERFDAGEWSVRWDQDRAAMAHDLIQNYLLPGLPKQEMVRLIGQPQSIDPAGWTGRVPEGAVETYSYEIGCWSFSKGGYDSTFVRVHLGSEERILEAEIGGY